jgi:hypothetical protein
VSRARTLRCAAAACGIGCLLAAAGCSEDEEPAGTQRADREPAAQARTEREHPARPRLKPPPCPADTANCRTAAGQIIYVERVDPDGDGDAHFVITSADSITAPGISVIDVKRSLRPSPLPGPGDWISAAGPVYEGSHGQSQIEAVRVRVRRRG